MGYTHYWKQKRAFTPGEWAHITAEANRIFAKAAKGMYVGRAADAPEGERIGSFKEPYAWRTFEHAEIATPEDAKPIKLANGCGEAGTHPEVTSECIRFNGAQHERYESFELERAPVCDPSRLVNGEPPSEGIFAFCKTEYRPYDAVVVSVLAVARLIAPDAITVSSDGGDDAIKLMF